MGLVIQGMKVLVDHNSKEHLVTTVAGNPKRSKVENANGEVEVFSIFTRLKATSQERRNRAGRHIGDNCPMIYALKGKEGLSTGYRSVREMLLVGAAIVDHAHQTAPWPAGTVIVCVPSSHSIVRHLAGKLSKQLGFRVQEGLLVKASVASAVEDLERALAQSENYAEKKDLKNVIQKLKKQEGVLSLKDVSTRYRERIQPVMLGSKADCAPFESILLVDDLVSTGTSLITAKNVLKSNKQGLNFSALSLFSQA